MGEDSRRYGSGSSSARDEQAALASRPVAAGKQTLAQAGAPAGGAGASAGSSSARGEGQARGERVGAWLADDDLMTAMGLSESPWCDAEEGEAASEEPRASQSEGGGAGGGESGGAGGGERGDGDGGARGDADRGERGGEPSSSQRLGDSANSSTGAEPAASAGGQATDDAQALSSVSLPAAEDASSSAPAPLAPGATFDVAPPAGIAPGAAAPIAKAAPVYGPPSPTSAPEAARPVLGPPAPLDEGAASSSQEDFLQAGWTLINEPAIVYDEAGALLRASPTSESPATPLSQNAKVTILKHNPAARWYAVVTGEGQLGYVADWLLWRNLPESSANVYRIKKGESPLAIARDHYGAHFTRWGQDLRFVVNALVYVNQNRSHNGTGKAGLAKKGQVSESWLRAAALEDVYVWLPSVDYLSSIYEEVRRRGGGTGSRSFDTLATVANQLGAASYLPSYVGGLAHGFLASLGDTLGGLTHLVKSVFTGEIIEDLKKLWSALTKLSIDDVTAAVGSWAASWAPRLTSENDFVRGHAWGYLSGYLCAELAMFVFGGAALEALKASRLATKLGQVLARISPRLTAAVSRVTATIGAASQALREAKASVLQRFGAALAEEIGKVRFRDLIAAAVASGTNPAAANRLARILHTAGIGARKVASWGDHAFANLAKSPRTLAELEATLPLVKSGRVVGLEDWLEFGATKTGDDAANVAAELREARRLAREYPEHKVNVGGDARAPKVDGDKSASFDLSVDDASGNVVRSVEMTSIEKAVTKGDDLSPALSHAIKKIRRGKELNQSIPGEIESVVEITMPENASLGRSGSLQISRTGDVVQVTKSLPPKMLDQGNIFVQFAEHATKYRGSELLDVVTVVDKGTGEVLGRIKRSGRIWKRSQ